MRWPSVQERFWMQVDKEIIDPCWKWCGSVWKTGANNTCYGRFYFQGRRTGAHRMSWILNVGPIPLGLEVIHKCDTPICVRPDHLALGTHSDNMRDMVLKGRDYFTTHPEAIISGLAHPNAKLDLVIAQQISDLYRYTTLTAQAISQIFGVAQSTISTILRNQSITKYYCKRGIHPRKDGKCVACFLQYQQDYNRNRNPKLVDM